MRVSSTSLSKRVRRGFTLVEVCLALGVVAAAVLALIGILGGTFTSAREIALQHRAINAISQLDGAMQSGSGILGLTGNTNQSPFDRMYAKFLATSNGQSFVDFYVYEKNQDVNGVRTPSVPVVYAPAGTDFPITEAKTDQRHDGIDTNSVFRIRIRVSPLLKGKIYKLNPATFEPTNDLWQIGTALPGGSGTGAADNYALAYLPLVVEVFPHDFSAATDPGQSTDVTQEKVRPILTQTLVINR